MTHDDDNQRPGGQNKPSKGFIERMTTDAFEYSPPESSDSTTGPEERTPEDADDDQTSDSPTKAE